MDISDKQTLIVEADDILQDFKENQIKTESAQAIVTFVCGYIWNISEDEILPIKAIECMKLTTSITSIHKSVAMLACRVGLLKQDFSNLGYIKKVVIKYPDIVLVFDK